MNPSTDTTFPETTNNPYTAPDSDLNTAKSETAITVFERFSAWGVFGLTLITLGIYYVYWLYTRTKRLNSAVDNKISDLFIMVTLVCYVINMVGSYAPFLGAELLLAPTFVIANTVLSLVASILFIVWAFKVRNRIDQMTNSEKGDETWCGPVKTFFFSCIYLQYKINQNLDLLNNENS